MADVFTDGTAYANLLATGYDKFLEFQLRSQPIFRQFVDKHPVDQTNPGPSVTLSIIQEFAALATTPLSEDVDISAVAPPAPVRVTVTLNEYGNGEVTTIRLRDLAFAKVDPAIAHILGLNMIDTMDKLVQNTFDGATHLIGVNGGVVKTDASGFAEASVGANDVMNSQVVVDAATLLRRRNVHGWDGNDQFVSLIHPDVAVDILTNTGWLAPHQYTDPTNIYRAEIGTYLGSRFITTPRATVVADGVTNQKVYRTYFLGRQGVVEAQVHDAHIVIGPQVDRLRRFFPVGWYAHAGWAIYRQEAIQIGRTTSSVAGM